MRAAGPSPGTTASGSGQRAYRLPLCLVAPALSRPVPAARRPCPRAARRPSTARARSPAPRSRTARESWYRRRRRAYLALPHPALEVAFHGHVFLSTPRSDPMHPLAVREERRPTDARGAGSPLPSSRDRAWAGRRGSRTSSAVRAYCRRATLGRRMQDVSNLARPASNTALVVSLGPWKGSIRSVLRMS